jgi:D-arabinose 1-dehydrogenase-like Zn-dependent alcohol dehydrogenase
MSLGAHHAVPTRDDAALAKLKGTLDFILVTANVSLNWGLYYNALAPKGRLHVVGAIPEPGTYVLMGLGLLAAGLRRRLRDLRTLEPLSWLFSANLSCRGRPTNAA